MGWDKNFVTSYGPHYSSTVVINFQGKGTIKYMEA